MPNPIDPMSDDLRRQRRNLIVISFILCLMKYGGITIKKATVFGTEIEFANTSVIFLGLWIMLIYFLVRYYQYFMQEGVPRIKDVLMDLQEQKYPHKLHSIIKAKHPTMPYSPSQIKYNLITKKNWHTLSFKGSENTPNPKPHTTGQVIDFQMDINLWDLKREVFSVWTTIIFNKSILTDYIFPIAFVIFTVIYCNLVTWSGDFLNVFFT